jgi:hypothetical protein
MVGTAGYTIINYFKKYFVTCVTDSLYPLSTPSLQITYFLYYRKVPLRTHDGEGGRERKRENQPCGLYPLQPRHAIRTDKVQHWCEAHLLQTGTELMLQYPAE